MSVVALSLWLFPAWLWGPIEVMPAPTGEEIAAAVTHLGDDQYLAREAATDFLWRAGEGAEPALKQALESDDAEVRLRAGMVLERFRKGYYPDVSPESAALIGQYRSGDANQQRAAIHALRTSGDDRTLWRLFRSEQDQRLRRELAAALRANLNKNLADLLADGKGDEVEQLLRLDAILGNATARRQLVTFYVLQDLLDKRLTELRRTATHAENKDEQQLLLAMEEAAGNHQAARELDDQLGNSANAVASAVRRHDWKAAAELHQARLKTPPGPSLEASGYAAIYHRLAGNPEAANKHLDDVRAVLTREPASAWYVMEILLLNEQVDEALAGLQKIRPAMAFELLCVRDEFDQAFAMVGVDQEQEFNAAWFANLPHGDAPNPSDVQALNQRHVLALEVAFFLQQCGRTDQAAAILDLLSSLAKSGDDASLGWRRSELCRIEMLLGLTERALDDAAGFMSGAPDTMILARLFPGDSNLSLSWLALTAQTKDAPQSMFERLKIVRQLLLPTAPEKQGELYSQWMDAAAQSLLVAKEPGRSLRRQAMIAAAIAHGDRARAIDLLDAGDDATPAAQLRAADLLREEQRFAAAAQHYGQVPPADNQHLLALYLQGWCEAQAATSPAGPDKRKLALMLAAEYNQRQQLLSGLMARKLTADAGQVRDLWLRTSPELSSSLAKDIGNSYAQDNPLAAADYWQQLVINLISTSSTLVEDAGYLTLTHQIHRTRAKAYLEQGKRAEFLRELAICRHILPSEWGLVEEFVPKMRAQGWTAEAQQLFDAQYATLTRLAKQYPQSARFSNGLAWTSAVCGEHLDDALAQAQHTLEIKPDEPAYLDTLAEVHFQRRELAAAVQWQQRAVELAPDTKQFRERLAKFEEALKADQSAGAKD